MLSEPLALSPSPSVTLFLLTFQQFAEVYSHALGDLHEKDRTKLGFLLNTWGERSFMDFELLGRMQATLKV
jgi:hypothetical protein